MSDFDKRIPELPEKLTVASELYVPAYDPVTDLTYKVKRSVMVPIENTEDFTWSSVRIYDVDEICVLDDQLWISQQANNLNVMPGTNVAYWVLGVKSTGSAIKFWVAGAYTEQDVYVMSRNSLNHLFLFRLTSAVRPFNSTNFGTELSNGIWEPVAKDYIDFLHQADNWKFPVSTVSLTDITLSGIGQTISGVVITSGVYVLVAGQTDAKQNGIYTTAAGAWTRAIIADSDLKIQATITMVHSGTYAGHIFRCMTFPITIGVSNIVYEDILTGVEMTANKGVAGGYASLDGSGKVPSAQLPSYVDDVLEYADLASFPVTGVSGVIYLAADTNFSYRWTGAVYVQIGGGSVGNASETVAGSVEEATDVEVAAGTATGGTGAKLFVSAAKLITFVVNSFFATFTAKTTPVDADHVLVGDSADSNKTKKTTWANVKATLKTYFDTFYSATLTAVSISSGTLTLDASAGDNFDLTTTVSSNFNLAVSNYTNMVAKRLFLRVTGTVVITMTTASVTHVMGEFEKVNGRWSDTADTLTIVGGTASPFTIIIEKDAAGTPNFKYYCSDKQL